MIRNKKARAYLRAVRRRALALWKEAIEVGSGADRFYEIEEELNALPSTHVIVAPALGGSLSERPFRRAVHEMRAVR